MKNVNPRQMVNLFLIFALPLIIAFFPNLEAVAAVSKGESFYRQLSAITQKGDNDQIEKLNSQLKDSDWNQAQTMQFKGHLRFLVSSNPNGSDSQTKLFFIRRTDGEMFLLSMSDSSAESYQELEKLMESKLNLHVKVLQKQVNGTIFSYARFIEAPIQPFLDKMFKLLIIMMLFLVMIGMGLTLTVNDFAIVVTKPRGIITGEILQFGLMPLVAVGLGYLMGFHEHFPYIYVGMVLIMVTPGGVTSNLMTHYAKGDVALSVSLTSLSTVLSIIFVPLLLNIYCANIPEIKVPTKTIALTIVVLVIVPLGIGMLIRKMNDSFAKKATPLFSALGIVALLFLIIAGILNNLEGFADTERHGVRFYTMVFSLTASGMLIGALVPKFLGVTHYQVRAISLETGLRNASLAMTLSLLIQDSMGDFHSSMFWVSGMFGLSMYIAGIIAIKIYPTLFPTNSA